MARETANAPFLRNAWYMAGWDYELDTGLFGRTIMNEPIAFFRDASGKVNAVEDRCCHRLAPLSLGRIEGDALRCMYHGLKFDAAGTCIDIPGQERIPASMKVRSFPIVEKQKLIWIWMGDPALADAQYRLVAGVSWYGPCDFEKTDLFTPPGKNDVRDRFGARILKAGVGPEGKLEAYREVSPVNYLRPESRPLLMIQGDMDPTIPVQHAHHMKARADAVNAPVEILIVRNSEHNWKAVGGKLTPSLDEIAAKTASFLKAHWNPNTK